MKPKGNSFRFNDRNMDQILNYLNQETYKNLPDSIRELIDNMVAIEGGTFMMGATPEQGSMACENEKPVHQVTLSSFSMSRYLITVGQWYDVMQDDELFESLDAIANDDFGMPMTGLSWNQCQDFISKLNSMTGLKFRLPTEAEWEYAARGGKLSHGFKYAGSPFFETVGWLDVELHYPGLKQANELGLFDMTGNASEWCDDYYKEYDASPYINPRVKYGAMRVMRGGGTEETGRISWRLSNHPDGCFMDVSFRLAL